MKPQKKSCLNCSRMERVEGKFACDHFIKGIPNSILCMKETCPFHSWRMERPLSKLSKGRIPGRKKTAKASPTPWEV